MNGKEKAMFGAGCFWGVQANFDKTPGVLKTTVGYSGGHSENPSYEEVCSGKTGHAEVVLIEYDPSIVTYSDLLMRFFEIHNPTTRNRQGWDVGAQYRSSIMYFNEKQKEVADRMIQDLESSGVFGRPIVTEVVKAVTFYSAEEYHQKYHEKHGNVGCPV